MHPKPYKITCIPIHTLFWHPGTLWTLRVTSRTKVGERHLGAADGRTHGSWKTTEDQARRKRKDGGRHRRPVIRPDEDWRRREDMVEPPRDDGAVQSPVKGPRSHIQKAKRAC